MLRSTLGAAALLVSAAAAFADPLSLRISGENPGTGIDLIMAQRFADNVKEKLGDDFSYEFYHSQALGDEAVHMQMIRTGQIDVYPMGSDAVQLDPNWNIFDLPFLFTDREMVSDLLDGEIGTLLHDSMRERAGLELLAFGEIGFRQISNSVRAVVVPSDMEGLKIRLPGSRARVLAFETYGAIPVTMNLGELYLGLSNGTVDGQENPVRTMENFSLQEVQKFLSLTNHVYTPVSLVMNGAKFDALSPEMQAIVKEAAQEAAEFTRTSGAETDAAALTRFRDTKVLEIVEADIPAFQEASMPVWSEVTPLIDEEVVTLINAAR